MIIISHRGNLRGPSSNGENTHLAITKALEAGFHVEVDVWLKETVGGVEALWLGHDRPQAVYPYNADHRIWWHCKNVEAFLFLLELNANCFMHDRDSYALTSRGILWAYPGMPVNKKCIAVLPENGMRGLPYGVCTDYPYEWRH